MQNFLLEMDGIDKRFHGVHALKGVHFDLHYGEIHALVGENGAGKSTLMKVLTGIHQADGGKITYIGEPYSVKNIGESQQLGISMIHQELNMMNHLTVAQNIYIGREPMSGGAFIKDADMIKEAEKLFERYFPGAVTLILNKTDGTTQAVRTPDHPLITRLLKHFDVPLIQTSANASGQPDARSCQEALAQLAGSVDYFVDGGMIPEESKASTVVDTTVYPVKILRQGSVVVEI